MPSYNELIATRAKREAELWRTFWPQEADKIAKRLDREEFLQQRRELAARIYELLASDVLQCMFCQHTIHVEERKAFYTSWRGGPPPRLVPVVVHALLGIVKDESVCLYYFGDGLLYRGILSLSRPGKVSYEVLPQCRLATDRDSWITTTDHLKLIIEALEELAT